MQATSASTASQLTHLMLSVVNSSNGTDTAAAIPGVQVAGKTGTAQAGTGKINAWFVAFAQVSNPQIAVAVVLPTSLEPTNTRAARWPTRTQELSEYTEHRLCPAHPAVMVVVALSPKDAWEQRLHRLGDTAPEVIGANARVFNDPW